MTEAIDEDDGKFAIGPNADGARLVQLRSGLPGPLLFAFPGLGGRIDGFVEFAALLDTTMPVYAVEARGVDGNGEPDHNIDVMVHHYISRIRNLQPRGPYFLLGHSFGGMVVLEVAQRLLKLNVLISTES